jgi:hypothetical protein
MLELADFIGRNPDFSVWLAEVSSRDYTSYGESRRFIPEFLGSLTAEQLEVVASQWVRSGLMKLVLDHQGEDLDPALALKSQAFWRAIRERMFDYALRGRLRSGRIQSLLEVAQQHGETDTLWLVRLKKVLLEQQEHERQGREHHEREAKRQAEIRAQEAEWRRQEDQRLAQARMDRIRELERLDPVERLLLIGANAIGIEPPWPDLWTSPPVDVVLRLPGALIARIAAHGRSQRRAPVGQLYRSIHRQLGEARRQHRQSMIDETRGWTMADLVAHLVESSTVVYWYPADVRKWIAENHSRLAPETIGGLRDRLGTVRERRWRRVAELLEQRALNQG